jgi:hypothetical protein
MPWQGARAAGVDNKPGTAQASRIVAKSAADGYTMLIARRAAFQYTRAQSNLSCTPDLLPVTKMTTSPLVLAVNSAGIRSVSELPARQGDPGAQLPHVGQRVGCILGRAFHHADRHADDARSHRGGALGIQSVIAETRS